MALINIDKFKDRLTVELAGSVYSVDFLSVREHVNADISSKLEKARSSPGEFCAAAVKILINRSDIPGELLEMLTLKQLEALLLAVQGVDPQILEKIADGGSDAGEFTGGAQKKH